MNPASTLLLVEVPIEIGGGQADFHVGVAPLEIMKPRDEPFQGHGDIDLDDEFIVVGRRLQGAGLGFDLVEGVADGGVIDLAGLGEFGPPGIPAEKLNAQSLFQGLHLMAHGGAGNSQFAGRQAKLPSRAAASKAVKARKGGRSRLGKILHQWNVLNLHSINEFHKLSPISRFYGDYFSPCG